MAIKKETLDKLNVKKCKQLIKQYKHTLKLEKEAHDKIEDLEEKVKHDHLIEYLEVSIEQLNKQSFIYYQG